LSWRARHRDLSGASRARTVRRRAPGSHFPNSGHGVTLSFTGRAAKGKSLDVFADSPATVASDSSTSVDYIGTLRPAPGTLPTPTSTQNAAASPSYTRCRPIRLQSRLSVRKRRGRPSSAGGPQVSTGHGQPVNETSSTQRS
jgi:hypothetical protein